MSAQEKNANDPNRGMNVKVWFTSIVISLVVLIVLAYFFLMGTSKKDVPKANQPHPNSRLVMPMQPVPLDVA
jgi:heme/copper-type cytochrome/quinol oxidase subunit 2